MLRICPSRARIRLRCSGVLNQERRLTILPVTLDRDLITTKSSHLWLVYFPGESYDTFGTICVDIIGGEYLGMEVKSCGYHWICKQDLQEFNKMMMNHEKSSARKRKIFEIEDEI